ncbi:MAG: protein kinase [Polyangiaceae bacterium]
MSTLSPNALFQGRYRVVRALKTGGMGEVYEVVDERTRGRRALKVLKSSLLENADQRARFAQEASVTGEVESEHLVRIFDAGMEGDAPFLVMELLDGEELDDALARRAMTVDETLLVLSQMASALEKTHEKRIIHRDIKPANVFLVRREDGSTSVRILDFGIAKVSGGDVEKKTRALGTPLYMAPEQILGRGDISVRADLYALGHLAYVMLVGEPYWLEDATAHDSLLPALKQVIAGAVEPASARALRRKGVRLPSGFDAWFRRAVAADPASRFESARAEVAALAEILRAPASVAAPAPLRPATATLAQPTLAASAQPTQVGAPPSGAATQTQNSAFQPAPSAPVAVSQQGWNAPRADALAAPDAPRPFVPAAPSPAPLVASVPVTTPRPTQRSRAGIAIAAAAGVVAIGGAVTVALIVTHSTPNAPTPEASASTRESAATTDKPPPRSPPSVASSPPVMKAPPSAAPIPSTTSVNYFADATSLASIVKATVPTGRVFEVDMRADNVTFVIEEPKGQYNAWTLRDGKLTKTGPQDPWSTTESVDLGAVRFDLLPEMVKAALAPNGSDAYVTRIMIVPFKALSNTDKPVFRIMSTNTGARLDAESDFDLDGRFIKAK